MNYSGDAHLTADDTGRDCEHPVSPLPASVSFEEFS